MTEPLRQLVERSNRIGDDDTLVVYGGGNTSAKGVLIDHLGREQQVMWVKGSGADMRGSTAGDYPALRMDDLLPLRDRDQMSDEEMTDLVARALLDPGARRPSIETLLHAFLPFAHIDHVHADAICALTNHAEGARVTREALGEGFAYVDWIRPGFQLSRMVGELAHYDGVVLAHHGLITWAEDSDACLARTLAVVDQARAFVRANAIAAGPAPRHDDIPEEELERLLLELRGAVSQAGRRVLRVDERLRAIADRADLPVIVAGGVSSADHMLRIKPFSLAIQDLGAARGAVDSYAQDYLAYVERQRALMPDGFGPHDPMPKVMLVPGLGAITTGSSSAEAAMVADIACHTHLVAATIADAFGAPQALPEAEIFGFDYWPMELYKLTLRPAPPRFAGHVFVVTGAASGIGLGISRYLAGLGASLVLADLDGDGLERLGSELTDAGCARPQLAVGDQSDEAVVRATIRAGIRAFGGIDGIVANAGIGVGGTLDELPVEKWEAGLRINLTSAFLLTQQAIRAMKAQGIGGSLVYIASKNAFGPGAGFGGYSVSKAGMIQLMRIAAIEGGKSGIRANAVNPDAVFDNSLLWAGGIREERAAAHGIQPEELEDFYASRNLLNARVRSLDVAQTVAYLLSADSSRTSGAVIPVDGGVAAAFPR
ncbi:MAG: SDR family oxidoreductase [Actinomycetales bacterium]|nr:SDR family oxidoreductase [Actinomycetales bacterium]